MWKIPSFFFYWLKFFISVNFSSACYYKQDKAEVTFVEEPQMKINSLKRQKNDILFILDQIKVSRVPL